MKKKTWKIASVCAAAVLATGIFASCASLDDFFSPPSPKPVQKYDAAKEAQAAALSKYPELSSNAEQSESDSSISPKAEKEYDAAQEAQAAARARYHELSSNAEQSESDSSIADTSPANIEPIVPVYTPTLDNVRKKAMGAIEVQGKILILNSEKYYVIDSFLINTQALTKEDVELIGEWGVEHGYPAILSKGAWEEKKKETLYNFERVLCNALSELCGLQPVYYYYNPKGYYGENNIARSLGFIDCFIMPGASGFSRLNEYQRAIVLQSSSQSLTEDGALYVTRSALQNAGEK